MTPHAAEVAGDGWKAYPKNKPERDRCYMVQTLDGRICIWTSAYACDWCGEAVVAFRELPPKYEPPKPKRCKYCEANLVDDELVSCNPSTGCRNRVAAQRDELAAKLAAAERVVEAAKKWRAEREHDAETYPFTTCLLIKAIDAYAKEVAK